MNTGAGFSYAQARIQARHGQRPDDADWSRLESCETAHAYLEASRSGLFAEWADALRSGEGLHDIEHALRAVWDEYLERIGAWIPAPWRPALDHCRRLASLPVASHVAGGGERAEWMGPAETMEGASPDLSVWRKEWHERMPRMDDRTGAGIAALEAAIDAWIDGNRDPEQASQRRAVALRETLEQQAVTVFRRQALRAGAVFAHLVLTALDLQRYRGGLLRRMALAGARSAP